jgi:hypothetical protein
MGGGGGFIEPDDLAGVQLVFDFVNGQLPPSFAWRRTSLCASTSLAL